MTQPPAEEPPFIVVPPEFAALDVSTYARGTAVFGRIVDVGELGTEVDSIGLQGAESDFITIPREVFERLLMQSGYRLLGVMQ